MVGSTAETWVLDAQVILPFALHRASAERAQFKVLLKCTKKNPGEDPATEQMMIRHLESVTDREKNWLFSEEKAEGVCVFYMQKGEEKKEAIDFPRDPLRDE